jgi:hypothetical protein
MAVPQEQREEEVLREFLVVDCLEAEALEAHLVDRCSVVV